MRTVGGILLVFSMLLMSCSKDDGSSGDSPQEDTSIKNQTLQGVVKDIAFTAMGGKAFDRDDDKISINITNIVTSCDDFIQDYELYISTTVPKKVGTYLEQNIVFSDKTSSPFNDLTGEVVITEITGTSISVKMKNNPFSTSSNSFFKKNEIEGNFVVAICN